MKSTIQQDVLVDKLNQFIRRYYRNKLIRGVLYSIGLWVSFFLILVGLEYVGYFSTVVRTILFYTYLSFTLVLIYGFIVAPLLKTFRLGKTISHEEAAKIIGKHFPEVKDKLLNVLQLRKMEQNEDNTLLAASISQKTKELSPIPFAKAIDFSKNKKYLHRTLVPVLILIGILIAVPSFLAEPTKRIVNYSTPYEKPAPFHFILLNDDLFTIKNSSYKIEVEVNGEEIPKMLHVKTNEKIYLMQKISKRRFTHTFQNLQESQKFHFESSGIQSKEYFLQVNPRPVLMSFSVSIDYPAYIGKSNEVISNVGDLILPAGSKVTWNFRTKDTKSVKFVQDSVETILPIPKNGRISYSKKLFRSANYIIYTANDFLASGDSLLFSIRVIEDHPPLISVLEQKDTVVPDRVFFRGQIKDDYGFSSLKFHLLHQHADDPENPTEKTKNLPQTNKFTIQEFYYDYHLSEENLKPGDKLTYYFEVCDNDAVNGYKCTRSQTFCSEMLSEEAFEKEHGKATEAIKSNTEDALQEIKKLQNKIKELAQKLIDKKEWNWQDKQQAQDLLQKQNMLQERIKNVQQQINNNNLREQQYKQRNELLMEKQKQIEKLFEEVMDEKMKKMLEELQQLSQEINKEQLKEVLDKIQMSNEDMEKQLDRNLELFKQLELDKKISDAIEKAKEIGKKQKKLAEETKEKSQTNATLQKEQEKLNQEFQKLKEELQNIERKNAELQQPNSFKRPKQREQNIEQSQKKALQKLQKKENKSAAQEQQSAAQEMEQLSQDLEQMQQEMEQQNLAEDIGNVRQLLKNLVTLSKNQETILNQAPKTKVGSSAYQQIINQQNKIEDDMQMVADSLHAIGKRQPMVGPTIHKELSSVKSHLKHSKDALLFYNQSIYETMEYNRTATVNQQYAMTSINNLALLLAESLKNMEQRMQNMKSRKSSRSKGKPTNTCNSPKPKPSAKTMRQMQEELNKQLQFLKKQLEQQGKNGQKPRIGDNALLNEELARAAAQQEAIRKMLQQYSEELKSKTGKANGELDRLQQEMEKNTSDIVNKIISSQTILRQQNILTRLLEHEKADLKQDKEEKRESRAGENIYRPDSNKNIEYNKLKSREMDLFRSETPEFSPYYRDKVSNYFYTFED